MVRGNQEEMPGRETERVQGAPNEQQLGKGAGKETSLLRELAEVEEEGSEGGGFFLRS